ncbi:ubiquinol-cytochrome c reductase iron-sulfur subunit [Rubrolithibacter danxiaensis]|uniref:QcrA and Rieske domain-containing protein n=1 Tax=Rubrolithibacter danxiaensis TaxID=3390805 RepID=UPI003BF7CF8C
MEREEFLKSLGLSLALVCTGACFSECKKGEDGDNTPNPPPGSGGSTKASVDLATKLQTVGSSVTSGSVLFIRIAEENVPDSFIATEKLCPHQGGTLVWMADANKIHCNLHASEYSADGSILQQPQGGGATRKLKIYATSIEGNTLTANVG